MALPPGGAAVDGAHLPGVIQTLTTSVGAPAGDVTAPLPDLDGLWRDSELCGDLFQREHPSRTQPLAVVGDAAQPAQLGERRHAERLSPSAGEPAFVEDADDLVVGMVVEQLVDEGDGRRRGGVQFVGGERSWDLERVGSTAREADVGGDVLLGAHQGDVGDEQAHEPLALAHRGGRVAPELGQVTRQRSDPCPLLLIERSGLS